MFMQRTLAHESVLYVVYITADSDETECYRYVQRWRSVLKQGGGGGVISKMSFALFVCKNKLLCNVYNVQ